MRFTLSLIALAAVAAPAVAAPSAGDTVTVKIAYREADLATTEGRAALEARIDAHLRKACALEPAARFGYGRPPVDSKCVADARIAALAEVEKAVALRQRSGRELAAN